MMVLPIYSMIKGVKMWITDIIKALHLLNGADERDFCIEKIENHFIYLTSGRRIAFYEIEDFLEEEENGE